MTAHRLILHGSFTSSSSYKPMLFLALSGLPFSFRTVNLKNGVQKEAAHLAINRYGQVPVLRHGDLTLVMSNVILDYLARTTGHFEPRTEQQRWQAREWLSWENDAITNVARVRHFARFRPDVSQDIVSFFRPLAEAALDFADKSLQGREWLVGDACSIADIGCWGRMVFAAEGGLSLDTRPTLAAWRDRLTAMPGFALPYDLIPKKDAEFAGAAPRQCGAPLGLIMGEGAMSDSVRRQTISIVVASAPASTPGRRLQLHLDQLALAGVADAAEDAVALVARLAGDIELAGEHLAGRRSRP